MIGTTLGRYRVLEPLGEGGMGRVYLAEDPTLARRVAIKVLPPEFAQDGERRARLLHEARAASALNHPNIVTVYDVGDEAGALFIAMERIEGVSLRDWAAEKARPPAEALALIRQATRALGAAHAAGLVHRDLKPENLMVRGDGLLKILDFGLARSVAPERDGATMAQTMPGTILGTAPYMSPEQVLGQPAGPASDVFSLGTLLYELMTARHPFAAATPVDTMHRILHETPPAPSTIAAHLPAALDFVVAKALAKDPSRRYANARELDVDLEACEAKLSAKPPAGGPGPRAIAVLPFKNLGGNAELDYLGIGLADAVITRLSSSPDLIVRGTSSIARYDKQPADSLHVARELDVAMVLDASFQKAGDRFRATARLVEAPGGNAVWAGKVDLRFADIFDVQDEVAVGIANALTVRLAKKDFTPSPEAYELALRAQGALRSARKETILEAQGLLERAVLLEPRYADAWARLGQCRHAMADSGIDPNPVWYAQAEAAFARALELDPDNIEAQFGMGGLAIVRGHKREAFRRFTAVYRAAPNHYTTMHYLAYLYRLCDMWPQFYAAEDRALEIDPGQPWPYWAVTRSHFELGHIDQGWAWLERIRVRFPGDDRVHSLEAVGLAAEGRTAEAVAVMRAHQGRSGFNVVEQEMMAGLLAANGQLDEARVMIDGVVAAATADMDFAAWASAIYGQVGDMDEAFRLLDVATQLGNDQLALYESKLHFGALHGDLRWPAFFVGVKERVAAYQREFTWPPTETSRA